ncbi:hypothetical protein GQ600_21660 [Phytophthora cactorum]|nr:hypothetical protein GQ600_21660 [Phytophthora cactorum]
MLREITTTNDQAVRTQKNLSGTSSIFQFDDGHGTKNSKAQWFHRRDHGYERTTRGIGGQCENGWMSRYTRYTELCTEVRVFQNSSELLMASWGERGLMESSRIVLTTRWSTARLV